MRILRDQKGTITSYAAILMTLILLFTALGLDLGRAFILKHQLQAMCDAASLAGASAVHAEFLYDDYGGIKGQILVVTVPLCDEYAQDTFNQNIAAAGFDREGVTVTSYHGWPFDANGDGYLDSYHAEITAEIRTRLLGPIMGMDTITVFRKAEAAVKQKEPLT